MPVVDRNNRDDRDYNIVTMGVESGGRRGRIPSMNKFRRDVPSRFENEVAQIRCLFPFFGYFGGRLAMCQRFVAPPPPTKKSVATPLIVTLSPHRFKTADGDEEKLPILVEISHLTWYIGQHPILQPKFTDVKQEVSPHNEPPHSLVRAPQHTHLCFGPLTSLEALPLPEMALTPRARERPLCGAVGPRLPRSRPQPPPPTAGTAEATAGRKDRFTGTRGRRFARPTAEMFCSPAE